MDYPLVSIMIPTYNQAHWLDVAMRSALQQDYPNLEIVVANDNSTDETIQLLNKYGNHQQVKVFTNRVNLGRVANYKHTLENYVTGEWVVNLDGDDYFTDKSFISSAIQHITREDNVVFVQAGHSLTDAHGNTLRTALPNIEQDFKTIDGTAYFLNFHHFSHLATVFNRKAAMEVGFYKHDILSADIECFLRLALLGKVIFMRKSVGSWVHHAGNESKKLSVSAVEKNMIRFRGPYEFAKETGKIADNLLAAWLKKQTDDYLLNYLTIYFTRKEQIPGYLDHVLKHYPYIRSSIILPKAYVKGVLGKVKNIFQSKKKDA